MRSIVLDTDGGVDDLLALALLIVHAAGRVHAVTTVSGNVPAEVARANCESLLAASESASQINMLTGCPHPLVKEPVYANDVHGFHSLCARTIFENRRSFDKKQSRALRLLESAISQNQVIIAIGPCTNIASVIDRAASAKNAKGPIIVMGGAFDIPGNITPFAEFNFFVDPHAAHKVMNSDREVILIPLDVCEQVVLTRDVLLEWTKSSPSTLGNFLNEIHHPFMDFYQKDRGLDGCYPHDALAVAAFFRPDLFLFERGDVIVETRDGEHSGRSIFYQNKSGNVLRAQKVDINGFICWLRDSIWPACTGQITNIKTDLSML